MLITDHGQTIRTTTDKIGLAGRNTQGVKIMTVSEGDRVIGFERLAEKEENTEGDAPVEGAEAASPEARQPRGRQPRRQPAPKPPAPRPPAPKPRPSAPLPSAQGAEGVEGGGLWYLAPHAPGRLVLAVAGGLLVGG